MKILIVDDEKDTADAFKEIIENMDFQVEAVYNASDGLKLIEEDEAIYLVITDLRMPDLNGMDFIKQAKQLKKNLYFIIVTAYGSISNAVEALKHGIYDYLTKPVDFEKLKLSIKNIYDKFLLNKENIYLKSKIKNVYSFDNIIGKSKKMQDIYNLITKVADTSATVLIRGESGTGKGLIARAIHFNSIRKDSPIIEVNCAAIPETLLESELFGHKKGSFTGAVSNRKGKFEEAAEGTVFLDEIGEISPNLQAKLLRVLQDKVFEPIGSNQSVKFKARIIASTNANLEKNLNNKTFREDLYYRLNVFPIYLPPLREHKEDIPLLVDFFLKKFSKENNTASKKINNSALNILMNYHWQGNIRELENLIERILIMVDDDIINEADLSMLEDAQFNNAPVVVGNLNDLLNNYEKLIIKKTLSQTSDNRTYAADLLKISLRQLHYKLKKYNL